MRKALVSTAVLALLAAGLAWGSSLRLEAIARRPLLDTRFDHQFHKGVNCVACHHNFVERGLGPKSCYACHKAWGTTELRRIDMMFHAFCTDCHRREAAAGRTAGPVKSCAACHVAPGADRVPVHRT